MSLGIGISPSRTAAVLRLSANTLMLNGEPLSVNGQLLTLG